MPTHPNPPHGGSSSSDGSGAAAFPGLGAGLEFFQQWMKAASSAMPGMGSAATQGATAWAMPTLDPEELDKRIQELKTVQFWLEQNARMLGMTIQTLEVQRMTLQTLKGMKVPMEALRESLRAQPPFAASAAQASPGAAAPSPTAPPPRESPAATPGEALGVNPMQWWSALTEQFGALASQAVQAGQGAMSAAAGAKGASPSASGAAPDDHAPSGSDSPTAPDPEGAATRPRAATQTVPRPSGGKPKR